MLKLTQLTKEIQLQYLLTLLLLLCTFQLQGHSISNELSTFAADDKIYLNQEQIEIVDGKIHVTLNGEIFSVSQLNCDAFGVFCRAWGFTAYDNTCLNGHKIWCWKCGGCVIRWCLQGRCKCVVWE